MSEQVKNPAHYELMEGVEAIEVIASSLTAEQWFGFCFGNLLKYRLRAGKKDDVKQEIGKADNYKSLYNQHKHLCKGLK